MGYVYALIVHHLGMNENHQMGLDFYIVRIGDSRIWPQDERHREFEPIALYARRVTAIHNSTAQVGQYLADKVRRGAVLARPVVPSVPVIKLEDLEKLYAEVVRRREEYDVALRAYVSERSAKDEAEKQAEREARKAEKREPFVKK